MTDNANQLQSALDFLASEIWIIIHRRGPFPSSVILAKPILAQIAPMLTAPLQAELDLLKTCGIVEIAVRNPNVADYMRHWEARAEAAEAKLAALVDGLATVAEQSLCAEIPDGYGPDAAEMAENAEFNRGYDAAIGFARAALAKIWASK